MVSDRGHPKSGESSLDGIITEIKEELGYDINSSKLKLLKTYKTEDDFVDLYYVHEEIDISKLKLQEEEVGFTKWFSKEEINKLIRDGKFLPSHIEFYKDCLKCLDK